ncbi:MAG TPA: hypothetical protein PKD09_09360 [Aggregatilinea sp.]|uniref:hypothetical protein n=1 Tax=Aggregatilinea sp. TaxID=2806333 RepID=UPI002C18AB66|nr:hypothetical protein [Aggregatilinea sp.]HML21844.1 hypothetical protein [Aggregatilinea sp.]
MRSYGRKFDLYQIGDPTVLQAKVYQGELDLEGAYEFPNDPSFVVVKYQEDYPCTVCDGDGVCPDCHGDDDNCKTCWASGCPECEGTGHWIEWEKALMTAGEYRAEIEHSRQAKAILRRKESGQDTAQVVRDWWLQPGT